jgi:hypothetical protein
MANGNALQNGSQVVSVTVMMSFATTVIAYL